MKAIWSALYDCIGGLSCLFSWALLLALSAKFAFGTGFHRTLCCFFIGLGINAIILVFGTFQLHPMAALYTNSERELHSMTTGLIMTPVIVAGSGGLYLILRRMVLVDGETNEPPEDSVNPVSTCEAVPNSKNE